MNDRDNAKVVTGVVRLSYAYVWEPHKQDNDAREKYSVQIIVPKSDKKTLSDIKQTVEKVYQENIHMFGKKPKSALTMPLHDGDEEKPDDPNYKDSYYFSATSITAPHIVDKDVKPILDRSEVYSGCYARVSLNFFPYDHKGHKGIGAGLRNIQKVRDGEPLSGSKPASADFDSFGEDLENFGFLD